MIPKEPVDRGRARKRSRYTDTKGCYVEIPFAKQFTRQYLGGVVKLHGYKGALLLSVEEHRSGCQHPPIYAWLRGDDFDAVIKLLRAAKLAWAVGHRDTVRWLREHGDLPKARTARRRRKDRKARP